MQSRQSTPSRNRQRLLRTAQVAIAGAALALLAACGGGDDTQQRIEHAAVRRENAGRVVRRQPVGRRHLLADQARLRRRPLHDQPGPWTQNVAQYYGDTLQPANQGGFGIPLQATGGLGYAQGGSRVTLQPGIGHADASVPNPDYAQATTTPIADQVKQYLAQHGSFNAGQIVLINGGANDIFYQAQVAQAQGNTPAAQLAAAQAIGRAAQQLGGLVQQIVAAGATHVFVSNVPTSAARRLRRKAARRPRSRNCRASSTRRWPARSPRCRSIRPSTRVGRYVHAAGRHRGQLPGERLQREEHRHRVQPEGDGPGGHAVRRRERDRDRRSPLFCSPQTYTVRNADQTYMFADTVHPTTRLHALFAQYVEQQIAKSGVGK
jgi:hypothetical protein